MSNRYLSTRASKLVLALAGMAALTLPAGAQQPGAAPQQQQQAPTVTIPPAMQHGPASVADLAEGLLGAVVNIATSQKVKGGDSGAQMPDLPEGSPFQDFFDEFFHNRQGPDGGGVGRRMQSLGSGFVIDAAEGIIITNNHVIADSDEIEVNFSDGAKLKAELVGHDTKMDLAVLKVDPGSRKLTEVKFGDSDRIRIGDWVMAIGNPFGLGGTVTVGIVSARDRDINSGPYDDYIQTDAAINRGNSGGPLFDMEGQVIGINTAIISPSGGSIGIGFAIPSDLALNVIKQLREFGETRRGWLGVRIQPVTDDVAESLGLKAARGALIAGIIKNGPVDNGQIQPGDVVLKFDGRDIREMRDLPRIVADAEVGKEVDVVIVRKGKEETVRVKIGRLQDDEEAAAPEDEQNPDAAPGDQAPVAGPTVLGMKLAEINDELRQKYEIDGKVNGVVVTEVDPDSAAAEKGIQPGDVIAEVAQEAVSTPQQVTDRVTALKGQGRRNALLMLSSKNGELYYETVRIN
jgi:serine protease Do